MSVVLLLAQTATTLFMTGVIWIVQTVHYWLRTALWSARSALILVVLAQAIDA